MSDPGRSERNRRSRKQRGESVRNFAQQAEALDKKRKLDERMQHRRRRRLTAYVLFVVASLVAVSHVLTHAGALTIIANEGIADLTIGYPTAGILAFAGLMLLPAQRY